MMIWNKQEVRMKRIMVYSLGDDNISNRMRTILRNRFLEIYFGRISINKHLHLKLASNYIFRETSWDIDFSISFGLCF
jgi:hypothetical protein